MEVLLSEDVPGLGDIGQQVIVKPGYARNFLIPRGFAIEAGSKNASIVAHKMRQIQSKKQALKIEAEEFSAKLTAQPVNLSLRVGSGGKVFGSIRRKDISEKLAEGGFDVDRRRVLLEEPIKRPGSYKVEVKLHPEVLVKLIVEVAEEKASKEEEEAETAEARVALEENSNAADDSLEESATEEESLEPPTEE